MWRPRINNDGAFSSIPVKKKRLSVDAKIIVKTRKRRLDASAAAREICDLNEIYISTVKRIASFKSRRRRKDADSTEGFDETHKDLIRRKLYNLVRRATLTYIICSEAIVHE